MASDLPRSILCVHPNRELYGSDRTFLQAVRAFRQRWPDAAITVLIPGPGLLADELSELAVDIRYDEMFVLRRSDMAALPRRLLALRRRIAVARATMRAFDLVYINTIVVLDYLLATRTRRKATLIHVHELPVGPTRHMFTALLRTTRGRVVFISEAVRRAFAMPMSRASVVWNGTRSRTMADVPAAVARPLRVLMIGRFNAWKGQGVLIDALAGMNAADRRRFDVRIVGSAFDGQEHFASALHAGVAAAALDDVVSVEPFARQPDGHYAWADVVTVPSVKPEPFGLVAIEGMAAGRPIIASDHGGLSEIVEHGVTGLLVAPGDPVPLAAALDRYARDRGLLRRAGVAARSRFEAEFDERIHMNRLADIAAMAIAEAV